LKFKKIGIIAKPHAKNAREVLTGLITEFERRECSILFDREAAKVLGDASKGISRERIPEFIDLLIVLGGDGTLLSAVRCIRSKKIPVLGVNLGSLGFLTDITVNELDEAIRCLETGNYVISSRLTLKTTHIKNGKEAGSYVVLNDAVINKAALARMISLKVTVNEMSVATFKADGIIVSTPTGSTAYSLAAGGPILYPTINAIIIAPICPHMLSNRPFVISEEDMIEISLLTDKEDVVLTLDGQIGIPIEYKDVVRIEKSDTRIDLIELPGSNFFNVLRRKLNWGPTNHE